MHDSVSASGAPSAMPRRMTLALLVRAYGASIDELVAEAEASAACIAARNAGVASGNGLWSSVPMTIRPMPAAAQNTAALPSRIDVAAGQVHVFVGRVITRRPSLHGPVRCRVDVGHVDREHDQRTHASVQSGGLDEPRDRLALGLLPGEPDADVDRLHLAARASSTSSTALSRPPERRTAEI